MTSKMKQVGKGDIRRLMKESKNKVNSPLAKYNSAGQLTCILCTSVVKNELVWAAHVNGKLHKDNVADLKSGKQPHVVSNGHRAAKRKHENGSPTLKPTSALSSSSSSSSSLPADFFEGASAPKAPKLEKLKIIPLTERKPAGILKNKKPEPSPVSVFKRPVAPSLTNGQSSSSTVSSSSATSSSSQPSSSSLPSDFYDAPINNSEKRDKSNVKDKSKDKSKDKAKDKSRGRLKGEKKREPSKETDDDEEQSVPESGELPDGFFDDPVEDAKVHHKPYVDPLDAQWELFQKEIKMEAHKSEVIEEEDDDVMIYERTLAEIDDQLQGWAKVEALHVKKEAKFIKIEIKEEVGDGAAEGGGDAETSTIAASTTTAATISANGEDVKVKIEPKEDPESEGSEGDTDDDDDDDDDAVDDDADDEEDDFDELLDWRSKGT